MFKKWITMFLWYIKNSYSYMDGRHDLYFWGNLIPISIKLTNKTIAETTPHK